MKALLIDDHPLILSAMQAVLTRAVGEWDVSGVETAMEARERLKDGADIDLVLLDLTLGDADGFEFLAELRRDYPSLPVMVVSASENPADVGRVLGMGAMGYVPKRASNELLEEALHLVLSGGVYVPPTTRHSEAVTSSGSLSSPTRSAVMEGGGADSVDAARAWDDATLPAGAAFEALGLTSRQREVLAQLLRGLPNKVIAKELGLSVETVKDHVAAVLRALGVNSRTQAVLAVAQLRGLRGSGGSRGPGSSGDGTQNLDT